MLPAWGVRVADVDLDGAPDIVAGGHGGALSVLLGRGDGTFAPYVDYDTGQCPSAIALADVNGDGWPDIVTARACDD